MNTHKSLILARTFFSFLYRDLYIYCKHLKDDIVNYGIIYPVLGSINWGYLQSNIFFGNQDAQFATMYLSGYVLLIILLITFKKMITLLFDLDKDHFIDYQITILPAQFILLERLVAVSIASFVLTAPFFVISKLLLGSMLNTSATNWPLLFIILILSCFVVSGYHMLASCVLRADQIHTLWSRCTNPLLTLGGFWAPWYIIYAFSHKIGILMYFNPLLYVTEGLRQALIGSPNFFSPMHAIMGLLISMIFFVIMSFIMLKRRVDHI